jgi:predicted DNA-binding transcriptional regulator YafY
LTRRIIALGDQRSGVIDGYCFLRQEERSFRLDRIQGWSNPFGNKRYDNLESAFFAASSIRDLAKKERRIWRNGQ